MRFSDVSASSLPYAARLDGVEKVQGMSSSMRLLGWPSSNARNVAVRYLTGSTSHILQFAIRLASNAQFSAPTSCPAKREFFRVRAIFLIWFSVSGGCAPCAFSLMA